MTVLAQIVGVLVTILIAYREIRDTLEERRNHEDLR